MPFLLLLSSSPGRELDSLKDTVILSSFVEKPDLRFLPGHRFHLDFRWGTHLPFRHWDSSSLAFTLTSSPCILPVGYPVSPHSAFLPCYVRLRVSPSVKTGGLVDVCSFPQSFQTP
jgi:hypothetical protein